MDFMLLLFFISILNFQMTISEIQIGEVNKSSCTVDKQLSVSFAGVPIVCAESYFLAGFEEQPKIILNRANVNRYYTLIMLDPDAPSAVHPINRSWLHWLIVNIEDADISTGFEVSEYNPPNPPAGSGSHRYVFLLFQQPEKETHYVTNVERAKFNINKYAMEHQLGNIAGLSYFKTKQKSDK